MFYAAFNALGGFFVAAWATGLYLYIMSLLTPLPFWLVFPAIATWMAIFAVGIVVGQKIVDLVFSKFGWEK